MFPPRLLLRLKRRAVLSAPRATTLTAHRLPTWISILLELRPTERRAGSKAGLLKDGNCSRSKPRPYVHVSHLTRRLDPAPSLCEPVACRSLKGADARTRRRILALKSQVSLRICTHLSVDRLPRKGTEVMTGNVPQGYTHRQITVTWSSPTRSRMARTAPGRPTRSAMLTASVSRSTSTPRKARPSRASRSYFEGASPLDSGREASLLAFTDAPLFRPGPRQPTRCELAAGRSIEVIDAGQTVSVGRLRTSEDDAVAAVCCCRSAGQLTLKCQTLESAEFGADGPRVAESSDLQSAVNVG